MSFYDDAMEIIDDLDPKTKAKMKAIIEEVVKDEGRKIKKGIKIISLNEALLEKARAKGARMSKREKRMKGSIKILAMDGSPGNTGAEGYMDDGSDFYKRFAVDSDGELHIMAEYPKSEYGNEYVFREIMGKFDPETFFMREGVKVDSMDLATLSHVYWKNYDE